MSIVPAVSTRGDSSMDFIRRETFTYVPIPNTTVRYAVRTIFKFSETQVIFGS